MHPLVPDPRAVRSIIFSARPGHILILHPLQGRDKCWSTDTEGIWGLRSHLSGSLLLFENPALAAWPSLPSTEAFVVSKLGPYERDRALRLMCRLCLLSPVFPHLVRELNAGLHVMILLLLFLALALALVSTGFAILNMIQAPYRAVNGPGGICLWNVLAGKEGPWGERFLSMPSGG